MLMEVILYRKINIKGGSDMAFQEALYPKYVTSEVANHLNRADFV